MSGMLTMALRSVSAPTTYSFGTSPPSYGWALCTVNDETGELSVQSDWGAWSYRWHAAHLGPSQAATAAGQRDAVGRAGAMIGRARELNYAQRFDDDAMFCLGVSFAAIAIAASIPSPPVATLTEFISGRSEGSIPYLAQKLASEDRKKREAFDPNATIKLWREWLCENRRRLKPGLNKQTAREVYDELADLPRDGDERDFVEAFWDIDGHTHVYEDGPSEHLRYTPTVGYLILQHAILPALVAACDATMAARAAERVAAMAACAVRMPLVHVVADGDGFECRRCGAKRVHDAEITVGHEIRSIGAFLAQHRGCEVRA